MYRKDYYKVILGLNKNIPFRSYNDENEKQMNLINVNIVAYFKRKHESDAAFIIVEKNGKFADFYFNGYEENFKVFSEPNYEMTQYYNNDDFKDGSWVCMEGYNIDKILKNNCSPEVVNELIECY